MTEQTDPKTAALQYIAQALNDYAQTMAPSPRGPFLRECQVAIKALEPKSEDTKAE